MKKLRLLVTDECERECAGCCNKDWDLEKLPICTSFKGYDEIMFTGGEPMLVPHLVGKLALTARKQNPSAKLYLYTADTSAQHSLLSLLHHMDGLTLTLHEREDVVGFHNLSHALMRYKLAPKLSLRLYVWEGVSVMAQERHGWRVKWNCKWEKNSPLPEGEVFMRLGRRGG